MVRTRRHRRRPGSSTRRSYRRRVRGSKCRGAGPAACRGRAGCKYASGRKRSFCRKTRNTRRHRRRRSRGGTLMSQVRRALVPYALYHSQKTHQRRRRRSRRSRRGGRKRRRRGGRSHRRRRRHH